MEGTRGKRSTNLAPNNHVLGLHQKIPQSDRWESLFSNGNNKNNLIVLFVKFG